MSQRAPSLKWRLAAILLAALTALIAANAVSSYRTALAAITTAHDRSLLAVARVIAERVDLRAGQVVVEVPYVALDFFESTLRGRVYYKVSGLNREFVSGFAALPPLPATAPRTDDYLALAHFHDAEFQGEPVRMVGLHQPVHDESARGMALVQVAETLVSREELTRRLFLDTLGRQFLVVAIAAALVAAGIRQGMRPLDRVSAELAGRRPGDLSPIAEAGVPAEVAPLVTGMNRYVILLKDLLDEQERFIADASHQVRTPLAVLRTQVDLALRETDPERLRDTLAALSRSLAETVQVTNQLLGRARARHGLSVKRHAPHDFAASVRQVCLDAAPAAVAREIDLGFDGAPMVVVRGDEGLLREAARNLVDNAIRYTPRGGRVTVSLHDDARSDPRLEVEDNGPGIPPELREKAFEPFFRLDPQGAQGAGLGLAIVRDIVRSHDGEVRLESATGGSGLRVVVRLPRG